MFHSQLMCLKNLEILAERTLIMSNALFERIRFKVGQNA